MRDVKVDPINIVFARVIEILTYIGIVLMIVPGVIYVISGSGLVDVKEVVANWDKSVKDFWIDTKKMEIGGYNWFLTNLHYFDCLSIVGVVILALAPLVAIIASITKADFKYKIMLSIIIIEFIIAIVRPLIVSVTGH